MHTGRPVLESKVCTAATPSRGWPLDAVWRTCLETEAPARTHASRSPRIPNLRGVRPHGSISKEEPTDRSEVLAGRDRRGAQDRPGKGTESRGHQGRGPARPDPGAEKGETPPAFGKEWWQPGQGRGRHVSNSVASAGRRRSHSVRRDRAQTDARPR